MDINTVCIANKYIKLIPIMMNPAKHLPSVMTVLLDKGRNLTDRDDFCHIVDKKCLLTYLKKTFHLDCLKSIFEIF